jgi:hypothetical protein
MLDAKKIIRAFEIRVSPLIHQTIKDVVVRRYVRETLLGTSVQVGLAMWAYASMARVRFDPGLAALGGSFGRVYDDLVDNFDRDQLDSRLAGLFRGEPFHTWSQLECLLLSLYRSIQVTIDRPMSDPAFDIVQRLHHHQCESRRQLNPEISAAELDRITRAKGGLTIAALFSLLRPGLNPTEQRLLIDVGHVFQLLDDHHDIAFDRAKGVTTGASRGDSTLANVARRILHVRRELALFYGRANSRRLAAVLYLILIGALLERRRQASSTPQLSRHGSGNGPLRFFYDRAENIDVDSVGGADPEATQASEPGTG